MEVKVPDIGDFSDVPVISVLVAVGDEVSAEDPLIELESDKATMEVPSPAAGVIKEIKVSEGDSVSDQDYLLTVSKQSESEVRIDLQREDGADMLPAQRQQLLALLKGNIN